MSLGARPARLVIEALRLDRWSGEEVRRRAGAALEMGVGGFVLFGGDAPAVAALTEGLRTEAGRPLWFGADLERGAGQQFRGLSELPPPAALASLTDAEEAVAEAGFRTGREALSVGINWVLAPVLDLDADRRNPIVATRSFSREPAVVARLGARWIEACQRAGALACAKHVPGHGRTLSDSHLGLPVVEADRATLEADLAPFEAVAPHVATLMLAHVAYPALGCEGPATLAPSIATALVRDRLGFEGPVATDAMIMEAVGEDDAAAAVGALAAGCDLILYPKDLAKTVGALTGAMQEDPALEGRARESISRARAALERCGAKSVVTSPDPAPEMHLRDPLDLAVRTIAGRPAELEGWDPEAATRIFAVSDDPEVGPPAGREGPLATLLEDELRRLGWRLTEEDGADQHLVVLAATPRGWKGRSGPGRQASEEARALVRSAPRGAVVLLGHARWLPELGTPAIGAWSTESLMERAAGRWLHAAVSSA